MFALFIAFFLQCFLNMYRLVARHSPCHEYKGQEVEIDVKSDLQHCQEVNSGIKLRRGLIELSKYDFHVINILDIDEV